MHTRMHALLRWRTYTMPLSEFLEHLASDNGADMHKYNTLYTHKLNWHVLTPGSVYAITNTICYLSSVSHLSHIEIIWSANLPISLLARPSLFLTMARSLCAAARSLAYIPEAGFVFFSTGTGTASYSKLPSARLTIVPLYGA